MKKLGILGGGQLGKMMLPHSSRLDLQVTVLDSEDCLCRIGADHHLVGEFTKQADVEKLGDQDFVTVEIENVSVEGLQTLERKGVKVSPSSHVLKILQDKGLQKTFLKENNFPTSAFKIKKIQTQEILEQDLVVKQCRGGYDGKGVWLGKKSQSIPEHFMELEVVLEEKVDVKTELSILVARAFDGQIEFFPLVEMIFDSTLNLIDSTFAPARVSTEVSLKAKELAASLAHKLEMVGVMAVELFLDHQDRLLINEIAPRVHNSGHFSIEACTTDQFEQHIRAVTGLPLGTTQLRESAMTINLIGAEGFEGETVVEGLEEILKHSKVYPHLYGKKQCRPSRKMGHITVLGEINHCNNIKKEVKKWLVVRGKQKL